MTVKVNNLIQKPLDGRVDMELDLVLPENVVIETSGKNSKYDTKMNSKGEIIEDLYVQIESISLDGFPLSEKYIHQMINILLHFIIWKTMVLSHYINMVCIFQEL